MKETSQEKKERNTILQLYAAFLASLVAGFIPHSLIAGLGVAVLIAVVLVVPLYQWRAETGSFLHNHMQYLNHTIWIGSLFLLICALVLGYWVYVQSDQSAFQTLFDRVNQGGMVGRENINQTIDAFVQANKALLMEASLICMGPPLVYIFYRSIKAISRASKIHRMATPKSWL